MKRNFALFFLSIFLIITVGYFAGCGDDNSSIITLPQGPAGATGATGNTGTTGTTGPEEGTASLVVNVWQDDAHTQPYPNAFTVRLERIYTNPGTSEITTSDTSGEGTVTVTNIVPGNYRIYVQSVGYPEENEDVEVTVETTTKAVANVDFVLEPEERVFYATSNDHDFIKWTYYWLDYSPFSTTKVIPSYPTRFYYISPFTGEAKTVSTTDGIVIMGLAFSSDNTLYAIGFNGDIAAKEKDIVHNITWGLYEINPFTGVITPLKAITGDIATEFTEGSAFITDLSSSPDGKLYAFIKGEILVPDKAPVAIADTVGELNIETGEITLLTQPSNYPAEPTSDYTASIGFPGSELYFLRGNGYSYSNRYVSDDDDDDSYTSQFYLWNNPAGTSSLTTVNDNMGYPFFSGMEDYDGNLYTVAYNYYDSPVTLISIAPATGTPTAVGNIKDELDNSIYYITDIATP